jgi:hypothetical protein
VRPICEPFIALSPASLSKPVGVRFPNHLRGMEYPVLAHPEAKVLVCHLNRHEKIEQQKREVRKKQMLEKRFKRNAAAGDDADDEDKDGAEEFDDDVDDEDKITETEEAGELQHLLCVAKIWEGAGCMDCLWKLVAAAVTHSFFRCLA